MPRQGGRRTAQLALAATIGPLLAGLVSCRPERAEDAQTPGQPTAQGASDSADLHRKAALALWMQGKREEALAEIAVALETAPDLAEAHMMRGQLLEELQKPAEARSAIERALQIDPKHVSARLTLARLLVREENLDGAERELRRVVEAAPAESEARRGLALVLIARGRLADALPEAREALRLRPDWPLALGDLAWILARAEDPRLRDAQQAVSLGEAAARATGRKHPGILDALAAAYAEHGEIPKAAATAEEALQLALDQRDDSFATRVGRRLIAYRAGTIDRQTPR
ncbi:MAG: tetratricopeptide repeat protein [Planctomycetota bacterium]